MGTVPGSGGERSHLYRGQRDGARRSLGLLDEPYVFGTEVYNRSHLLAMAVNFLTGKLGSGKTLCVVGKIRDYLKQGRRVATNLDLNLTAMLAQ